MNIGLVYVGSENTFLQCFILASQSTELNLFKASTFGSVCSTENPDWNTKGCCSEDGGASESYRVRMKYQKTRGFCKLCCLQL